MFIFMYFLAICISSVKYLVKFFANFFIWLLDWDIKYNSHSIQFTHLMLFSVVTELCRYYQVNIRTFLQPQRGALSILPASISWQPLTSCLYGFAWMFHVNGIIQYVVFCDYFVHFLNWIVDLSLLSCEGFEYCYRSCCQIEVLKIYSPYLCHSYSFSLWCLWGIKVTISMTILVSFSFVVCFLCPKNLCLFQAPQNGSMVFFFL